MKPTNYKSKTLLLTILAASLCNITKAQSIAPQSINSGGISFSQPGGSLSFTVGELVVLNQTDSSGNSLGGGFTNGATLTTEVVNAPNELLLDVNVFPNPTADLLNIQINRTNLNSFMVTIQDIQSKKVFNGTYAGIANIIGINTFTYPVGTYVLTIHTLTNELIGSYKIIKK